MKIQDLNKEIKEIKNWAKVHLKEPILNKETGFLIEVTRNGLEHSLQHDLFVDKSGRFFDLLAVIKKFKTILKDAKLLETRSDKYELNEKMLIHEFFATIELKGKTETLQIIVKEFIEGKGVIIKKRIFYNHRFVMEEIKKP